jgi:hypothetical protein
MPVKELAMSESESNDIDREVIQAEAFTADNQVCVGIRSPEGPVGVSATVFLDLASAKELHADLGDAIKAAEEWPQNAPESDAADAHFPDQTNDIAF